MPLLIPVAAMLWLCLQVAAAVGCSGAAAAVSQIWLGPRTVLRSRSPRITDVPRPTIIPGRSFDVGDIELFTESAAQDPATPASPLKVPNLELQFMQ